MKKIRGTMFLWAIWVLSAKAALAAADPCANKATHPSILMPNESICDEMSFNDYLKLFIKNVMPLVIGIAVLMVIVSGVQYMTAGANPKAAESAKTRIIGIITGVLFFVLMKYILQAINPSISL